MVGVTALDGMAKEGLSEKVLLEQEELEWTEWASHTTIRRKENSRRRNKYESLRCEDPQKGKKGRGRRWKDEVRDQIRWVLRLW